MLSLTQGLSTGLVTGLLGSSNIIDTAAKTVSLVGDSISDQNSSSSDINKIFENVGWINVVRYKSRQRYGFTDALNFGNSGDTTAEMVARKATFTFADINFTLGGTNDIAGQVAPATTQANLQELYDYQLDTLGAERVFALTIPPRSEWGAFDAGEIAQGKADIAATNTWIKSNSDVTTIDIHSVLSDGSGDPLPDVLVDGVHLSPYGAELVGDLILSTLDTLYGRNTEELDLTGNVYLNGDMTGTGGISDGGMTGDVATSWQVLSVGAETDTSWRTLSKDADDNQVIEINVPQGNGTVGLIFTQRRDAPSSWDTSKTYKAQIEVDVQSVTGVVDELNFEMREEQSALGNIRYIDMDDRGGDVVPAYGEGVMEAPIINPQSDSSRMRVRFFVQGDTTNGAISARVVLKKMRMIEI